MADQKLAFQVFRYRPYSLHQVSRLVSIVGHQMQSVAIGWQVYDISQSALDLGMVGLALFLPALFFGLIGGDVADRFNRRRVVIVSQIIQALSSLILVGLTWFGIKDVMWLYPAMILLGISRAFGGPAGAALLPHLVPGPMLARAIAWSSSIWQVATIAGPAFGGMLYGSGGPLLVYSVSCGLALLAAICEVAVGVNPPIPTKKGNSIERLKVGLRFVWTEKRILGTISLDLFAVLLGGAVALLPIFAKDILHVGPFELGLMRSTPALGATLTAIVLAYWPLQRRAGPRMFGAVFVFGIATCAFGLSQNWGISLIALFVMGASDMVSVVVRSTLVQTLTPEEMRGRVSSVNQLFIGASNELGEFESGLTAHWFGSVPAVIIGGVGTCLIVAIWLVLFPKLRQIDTLDNLSKAN